VIRVLLGSLNLFMRHQGPTGVRRGPPVLILHGVTFPSVNAAAWKIDGRSWMDELSAAGYDVYALDFLGYGESDRYPEMAADTALGTPLGTVESMVAQVESAVARIVEIHGGECINLVAHSAGTLVGARFAQVHPDRVARLVLFGAPVPAHGGESSQPPADSERYLHVSRADQLSAFEPKVRESGLLDSAMFETWAQAYLATDPRSGERQPPSVRVPAGMTAAYHDLQRHGRLPYDPGRITMPVLVIQGEWDLVSPPAAGLWLFEQLGTPLKRFVVVSQAGHRAHLESNRWQLYRETETFLNGGDSAAGPAHAVFFEVKPKGEKGREAYLAEARVLRSQLVTMSGFVSVERFDNRSRPGWLLSLSIWRDEAALIAWREVFEHRVTQEKGRHGIFEDYRIRVARQVTALGELILLQDTEAGNVSSGTQHFVSITEPEHHVVLSEDKNATGRGISRWKVIRDYGMYDRRQAPHQTGAASPPGAVVASVMP
jgi:pimeloyl-ACP methyl ester carboxylesterase/heme-degrading monooxygenase HmoA